MTEASDLNPDRPMAALLAVQQLDTEIHQLLHRRGHLPEATEFEAANAERAALGATIAEVQTTRDELGAKLAAVEDTVAKQQARHAELARQMGAAQNVAPRDLEAMDHELHQVAEYLSSVEDEELAVLEELEPVDAHLASLGEELAALEARLVEIRQRGTAAVRAIDVTLAERRAAREAAAALVPASTLDRYEAVRKSTGAIGAARLRGDRCDGCSLTLSAAERDRVLAVPIDELASCEHCGRILIRDAQLG